MERVGVGGGCCGILRLCNDSGGVFEDSDGEMGRLERRTGERTRSDEKVARISARAPLIRARTGRFDDVCVTASTFTFVGFRQ